MQWTTYIALLILIAGASLFATWDDIVFYKNLKKPTVSYEDTSPIDYGEPYQDAAALYGTNSFTIYDGKKPVKLIPRAAYEVSGLLIGTNTNFGLRRFNWSFDRIAPIDYAIAWGENANKNFIKDNFTIAMEKDFSNGGRVVYVENKNNSDAEIEYSITHLIPRNKNILNAIMSAKIYDGIYLTGILVDIANDNKVINETSLSRLDDGAGSGEIMYVSEIRINDKVYD